MAAELVAPVVKQIEEKRIVYGPVLIPNEPDTDDDVVTPEKIEEVAHKFMENYRNIDLQHSLNNVGNVVESYILPMDWQVSDDLLIPAGSWIMGVKVQDDDAWEAVKNGELTGFSIMGISKYALKSSNAAKNQITFSFKRTTLADLGNDWIVNAVSLVDEPAVPKAKFIAIKSKGVNSEDTSELVKKYLEGSIEAREQLVRRKVYATFDSEITDSYVKATYDDFVIVEINNSIERTSKLFRIGYQMTNNGDVVFTGEPEEVIIREVIEPVNKTATQEAVNAPDLEDTKEGDITPSEKEKTHTEANKGLFGRLMEKLGWQSKSNKGGEKVKKEEIKAMIDESIKSVEDKVEEILNTLKSEPADVNVENKNDTTIDCDSQNNPETNAANTNETDVENNVDKDVDKDVENNADNKADSKSEKKSDNSSESNDENVVISKAEYDELLNQIETLKRKPFSRRLTGQDGGSDAAEKSKEDEPLRDAFGYKINRK